MSNYDREQRRKLGENAAFRFLAMHPTEQEIKIAYESADGSPSAFDMGWCSVIETAYPDLVDRGPM